MRAWVIAAVAFASLSCDRRYNPDAFILSPTALDSAMTLTPDATSLPADGFSRTRIVARLADKTDKDKRTVSFTTTAGTLIGPRMSDAVQVPADSEGVAVIELESSKTIGRAVVRATVGTLTRQTEITFVAITPSDVVTLSAAPFTVPADGETTARVTVTIAAALPPGRRVPTFITSLGEFGESRNAQYTAPAVDATNRASAELRSGAIGSARVQVSVDGVSAETSVDFVTARPESIRVTTSAFFISAAPGQPIEVKATLVRSRGTVTRNTPVDFIALRSDGVKIGHFSAVTASNAEGVATAAFSVEGETYVGPVTITATAAGVSGITEVRVRP